MDRIYRIAWINKIMELLRGISQKVERVVLNALASDAALPPNFLIKVSRQYAKKHGAFRRLFSRIAFRRSRSTLVAAAAFQLRQCCSMPIQTVVQLPASQCLNKCCVILERTSDGTPN